MDKISNDYKYIRTRTWNKHLDKCYCTPETGKFKYISYVTWGGIDFSAGGNTEEVAKKSLVKFINE